MSVTNGPRRGLMINALTGDGFDSNFRQLLRAIDALLFCSVVNLSTSAPPGSPANGDAYVVKATGTGAWAGHDNAIAIWTTDNPATPGGLWEFYSAGNGMIVYSIADVALAAWNGSAWAAVGGGGSSTLAADTDVVISSPANDDVLTYETSSTKWKNKPASSGFSNPMTTSGDLIVGGASGSPGRLALGSSGQVPTVVSGAVVWQTPGGGGGGGAVAAHTSRRYAIVSLSDRSGNIAAVGDKALALGGPWNGGIVPTTTHGSSNEMENGTSNWVGGYNGALLYCTPANIQMLAIARITSLTDIRMFIMLSDTVGQTVPASDTPSSSKFAGFRYSSTAGDTNFQCCTSDGSTQTTVDSGVAADLNSHLFAIEFDDAGPNVKFYIDGTLVATITTNLPPSGTVLAYQAGSSSSSPGGSQLFDFEQVQIWSDR